jgi:hypothetical protein
MTIVFSDLHLQPSSAEVALEVLREVAAVAEQHKDGHVVFAGDFFMVRHTLHARLMLDARDAIAAWPSRGVKRFDVVVGNHDCVNLEGRNALELFDGLGSFVRVHTMPTWTEAGLMLPYRHTADELRAALALKRPKGASPTLFGHFGVRGAWMNSLQRDEDGLPAEDILQAGFKTAILGHYHRHGAVVDGVSYVGSPYQVSYAEAGQPKGVCRWDGALLRHLPWDIGPKHHKVVFDADHPQPLAMPKVRSGDKLWVVVKGQLAKAAQATVQEALKNIGLEPARIDVDYQPEERAARIEIQPEEPRRDTALRFVQAQDVGDSYKAMLVETFHRVVA